MQRVKLAIGIVLGLIFVGFMSCAHAEFLPSSEKVNITGTEVKRLDPSTKDPGVRDRRYLLARRVSDGQPVSFLNEDTRWGWPFYFKFNSADLSAQAADIVRSQPEAVVLVKYYGFRSALLDEFPNVTSMQVVDKDYVHIPIFNIMFYVLIFGTGGTGFYFFRRWRAKKQAAS